MIPNILNTIVGIALVYCAILAPQLLQKTAWVLVVSGIGIIASTLAELSDRTGWMNSNNPQGKGTCRLMVCQDE